MIQAPEMAPAEDLADDPAPSDSARSYDNIRYDDRIDDETNPISEQEAPDLLRLQKFLDKHAPEHPDASQPAPRRKRPARKRPRPLDPKAGAPQSQAAINLAAHQSRCRICCDPERGAIEEAFTHWHSTRSIAHDYDVDRRSIYRHAHALNLFAVRDRNLRFALAHIIEDAERVSSSADSVIRAVRAFTCVNTEGRWIDPPAHVIVSSGAGPAEPRQPAINVLARHALPGAITHGKDMEPGAAELRTDRVSVR